jgi:hypothetical protein
MASNIVTFVPSTFKLCQTVGRHLCLTGQVATTVRNSKRPAHPPGITQVGGGRRSRLEAGGVVRLREPPPGLSATDCPGSETRNASSGIGASHRHLPFVALGGVFTASSATQRSPAGSVPGPRGSTPRSGWCSRTPTGPRDSCSTGRYWEKSPDGSRDRWSRHNPSAVRDIARSRGRRKGSSCHRDGCDVRSREGHDMRTSGAD